MACYWAVIQSGLWLGLWCGVGLGVGILLWFISITTMTVCLRGVIMFRDHLADRGWMQPQ